jgi:hypothetical protein
MKTLTAYCAIAAFAATLVTRVEAVSITGGVSFNGLYAPQTLAGVTSDLATAERIAFGYTYVGGTSGSFSVIPAFPPVIPLSEVSMFTPLVINPATLPGSALWTVSSGAHTFSMTLTSMTVGPVLVTGGVQSRTISGSGIISYSGPLGYVPTYGDWVGTFNSGSTTFTWSASNASTGHAVPEGGSTTLMLLGSALAGLALLRRSI